MHTSVYTSLLDRKAQGLKSLAILVDPDKADTATIQRLASLATPDKADLFLVGGSLLYRGDLESTLQLMKKHTSLPLVLFPGSNLQVSNEADAILLLSLISGRNADFLIGQHVVAAPIIRKAGIEYIPTGYMLIDGGRPTSVSYISNTSPIPRNKPEIAVCTAMAGEMLGLKAIYLEAGSGAEHVVPLETVKMVREHVSCLLIVGGGIRTPADANALYDAGADLLVVGTKIEESPDALLEIASARR